MDFFKEIEKRQIARITEKLGLVVEKLEIKKVDNFNTLYVMHSLEQFGHRYHIYLFSTSSMKEKYYDSSVIDSDKFIPIEEAQERVYNYFQSLANSLKPSF